MLALFREISFRHWTRSPLRSGLVVLGIALGVALYVATEAASASMFAAFGEFVTRVSGRADLSVESTGVGVPNELVGDIADLDGVAHAAANLELMAQAPKYGESILVLGVDLLGDLHFLPFQVEEGEQRVVEDPLAFVNDPTAILLSRKFATRHGLSKEGKLELLTSEGVKEFTIRGVLEDSGPAASFGGQVAVMFMDAAQVAFARGTFADRIDVALEPAADPAAVQTEILALVGDGFTVQTPESMGNKLRDLIEPFRAALWLSGILALLVGGFLVYNAVGVAVAQRRREIGLLRAFGVTRRAATFMFAAEAGLLAIPGVALGLWLGSSLTEVSTAETIDALRQLYVAVPAIEATVTPHLAAEGAAAGIITAVLAAWWPARRGSAIDPAVVLRGSASLETKIVPHRPLALAGMVVGGAAWLPQLAGSRGASAIAIVLTVIGASLMTPAIIVGMRRLLVPGVEAVLGLPGRLGLDYVERALGRSTVNVLALMLAVGMTVSAGGWLSSLEHTILGWADQTGIADLSITQGSPLVDRKHVPLAPTLTAEIARVPGVDAVQRLRIIDQEIQGKTVRLVATDTEVYRTQAERKDKGWTLVAGEPLKANELASSPLAMLSENAARRLGLGLGDRVDIPAPSGTLTFVVRAIIVDYTADTGAVYIDWTHYDKGWGDEAVDGAFVYADPDKNVDTIADAVRKQLGGGGIFVTKTAELRSQLVDTLRKTFSYSESVELVTLLIALMGVVGTMAATVLDRTREIGMLRAIGATRRQVATAVVTEAAFLGFCAAVVGAALGLVECQLFLSTLLLKDTGWHMELVMPWGIMGRIGGLVVLTSAVAGGLPAWRAARTDVASAMVCE